MKGGLVRPDSPVGRQIGSVGAPASWAFPPKRRKSRTPAAAGAACYRSADGVEQAILPVPPGTIQIFVARRAPPKHVRRESPFTKPIRQYPHSKAPASREGIAPSVPGIPRYPQSRSRRHATARSLRVRETCGFRPPQPWGCHRAAPCRCTYHRGTTWSTDVARRYSAAFRRPAFSRQSISACNTALPF